MQTYNIHSKWYDGSITKPQYIHSATSIYIIIKYPQTRPSDSFYGLIAESGAECEQAWLKIATDVLNADSDGAKFVANSDNIFNNNRIQIVDGKKDVNPF